MSNKNQNYMVLEKFQKRMFLGEKIEQKTNDAAGNIRNKL